MPRLLLSFLTGALLICVALSPTVAAAQSTVAAQRTVDSDADPRCHDFDNPIRWRAPHIPREAPRLRLERACLLRLEAHFAAREHPSLAPIGGTVLAIGGAGLILGALSIGVDNLFGGHVQAARMMGITLSVVGGILGAIGLVTLLIGVGSVQPERRVVATRRRRIERALVHLALSPEGVMVGVDGAF